MKSAFVRRNARRLRRLTGAALACNLLALLLTPGLVLTGGPGALLGLTPYENPLELPLRVLIVLALGWTWVWTAPERTWLLTMALLAAGCCTAALLRRLYRALGETAERGKKSCWGECL